MKVYCYPSPGGPIPVSLFLHPETDAERALLKYIADAYVTTGFGCKPDGAMDHVAVMLTPKVFGDNP